MQVRRGGFRLYAQSTILKITTYICTSGNYKVIEKRMEESIKKSKLNKGCWLTIAKIAGVIVAIYVIEYILNWVLNDNNKDELSSALLPFHNNYFSFNSYYLTDVNVFSQTSNAPSASLRFVIYY